MSHHPAPRSERSRIAALLITLGAITLPLSAQTVATDNTIQVLSPFTVAAASGQGYLATNSASATRINSLIQDTPMNIAVLTRDYLNDLGATDLATALTFTSGVLPDTGLSPGTRVQGDALFTLRGLQGTAVFRDGFGAQGVVDIADVSSIEIVKGPASVFYGNSSPGGIVNIVSKLPNSTPDADLRVMADSYGLVRAEFNYNQPLTSDHQVLFRVDGDGADSTTFQRFVKDRSFFIAPTVQFRIVKDLTFTTTFEYLATDEVFASAVPEEIIGDSLINLYKEVPRDYQPSNVSPSSSPRRKYTSTSYLDINITPEVSDRVSFNVWNDSDHQLQWTEGSGTISPTYVALRPEYTRNDETRFVMRDDFLWVLKTGPVTNKLIAGGEHSSDDSYLFQKVGVNLPNYFDATEFDQLPSSLFIVPQYSDPSFTAAGSAINANAHNVTTDNAGYLTDVGEAFGGKLNTLIGGRYDSITSSSKLSGFQNSGSKFSPQISGLYNFAPGVGAYASYSTSLTPNGLAVDGSLYSPERGIGREGGLKFDLDEHALVGTVSVFDISRANILSTVYVSGANGTVTQTSAAVGEQRSQGWDTDWVISASQNLQFIVNYSNFVAKVTQGRAGLTPSAPSPNLGLPLIRAPRQSASIWGNYRFLGSLKGLSLGGGLVYSGKYNTKEIAVAGYGTDGIEWAPAYARLDVTFGYRFKVGSHLLTLGLNLQNLTNRLYISGSGQTLAPPRTVLGTVSSKF